MSDQFRLQWESLNKILKTLGGVCGCGIYICPKKLSPF